MAEQSIDRLLGLSANRFVLDVPGCRTRNKPIANIGGLHSSVTAFMFMLGAFAGLQLIAGVFPPDPAKQFAAT